MPENRIVCFSIRPLEKRVSQSSQELICLGFVVAMVTLSVPLAQIPLIKDCL